MAIRNSLRVRSCFPVSKERRFIDTIPGSETSRSAPKPIRPTFGLLWPVRPANLGLDICSETWFYLRCSKMLSQISANAWGMRDRAPGEFHHLAHHSADVAAGSLSLIEQLKFRARANAAQGRPVPETSAGKAAAAFPAGKVSGYDWRAQDAVMGRALPDRIPRDRVFVGTGAQTGAQAFLLRPSHAGGLDRIRPKGVPIRRQLPSGLLEDRARSREQAGGRYRACRGQLAPAQCARRGLDFRPPVARPAQQAVGALPANERLVLLKAETGSGETEAAPWRFATLLAAGEVDALYFAVPTRAAAQHLLRRVHAALLRMFDPAPEAILAVPGQLLSGEAAGRPLPGFAGLWDDTTTRPARWAAEHVARCLTAQVAVGTVDRLALGGLRVKYGHLRGSARSRALVVIDEVHASDACMTEVQLAMVRSHLALGGHAMLMSATLGWQRGASG
ncbi:hypothetical protein [Rhodovulum kholense]|uniref:hypothetical protein n=1 Tax=Rhodovulum kholense TaxID=453584 RepID=UPI0011B233F1|nr:hypothetical protein [Rhodovulum kholense]